LLAPTPVLIADHVGAGRAVLTELALSGVFVGSRTSVA
jgi:hypothetical protein